MSKKWHSSANPFPKYEWAMQTPPPFDGAQIRHSSRVKMKKYWDTLSQDDWQRSTNPRTSLVLTRSSWCYRMNVCCVKIVLGVIELFLIKFRTHLLIRYFTLFNLCLRKATGNDFRNKSFGRQRQVMHIYLNMREELGLINGMGLGKTALHRKTCLWCPICLEFPVDQLSACYVVQWWL